MPSATVVYKYGRGIKNDFDIFEDGVDEAFEACKHMLQADFVADIKHNKLRAPCSDSVRSWRQCVWANFLGEEGQYTLDELTKKLKNYLPVMIIEGHPDKTEELKNIRNNEIRKVFELLFMRVPSDILPAR